MLRLPARPLSREDVRSREVQQLIELMRETMYAAPGVGLAAPQVGEPLSLVVIEDRAESMAHLSAEERVSRGRAPIPFHVLVNPVLTVVDGTPASFFEGCLSLSGFAGVVARASSVRVDALDHHGDPTSRTGVGWYARILQHETDHVNGTLYIDRMETRSFTSVENQARFSVPRPRT